MSRHRNVRNLVEDDYYDYDDDDDYDDYDDYPPPKKQPTQVKKVTTSSTAKTIPNNKPATNTTKGKAGTGVVPPKQQQQQGGNKVGTISTTNKVAAASSSSSSMPSAPTSPPPGFGTVKLNDSKGDNTIVSSSSSSSNNKTTTTTQTNDPLIISIPEYFKHQQQLAKASTAGSTVINKPSLNVVVIGHVDAGKSTLTGRLLHYHNNTNTSTGSTNGGTNAQQQKKLYSNNKQSQQQSQNTSINYSWLLDEDIQERERGITMDIGTKFFSTPSNVPYNITIIDSPGHADYVPAMIVGTSTADVAIVVIDCSSSGSSSGSSSDTNYNNTIQQQLYTGQLREHLLIARGLDIKQLLIVFNKMDIILWNEQYYNDMKQYLLHYITSNSIGFTKTKIKCIPVSGYNGINVITKFGDTTGTSNTNTTTENMKWITNEITLLHGLYTFDPPPVVRMKLVEKPFRMILGDINIYDTQQQQQIQMQSNNNNTSTASNSIITGIAIRGKIIQGWIRLNEKLVLLPSNDNTSIQRVLQHNTNSNTTLSLNSSISTNNKQQKQLQSEYIGPGEFIECIIDDTNFTDTSKRLLSNGMILCRPVTTSTSSNSSSNHSQQPRLSNHFRARILLIDPIDASLGTQSSTNYTNNTTTNAFSTIPIIRGSTCIFHMHYIDVPCYFSTLLYTFKQQQQQQQVNNKSKPQNSTNTTNNNDTNSSIIIERKNPRALTFSSSSTTTTNSFHNNMTSSSTTTPTWAMVEIILNTSISNNLICMESYNDCRTLGRFILRRNGISIAIGRIEQVLDPILL